MPPLAAGVDDDGQKRDVQEKQDERDFGAHYEGEVGRLSLSWSRASVAARPVDDESEDGGHAGQGEKKAVAKALELLLTE